MKKTLKARQTYAGPHLVRLPDVLAFSGYGRTQLFEKVKIGQFPKPLRLSDSGRAIAWDYDELLAWRDARKAKRDGEAA